MESVPLEGDRYLKGEARVENASRLPERNSCHRQMFSSCCVEGGSDDGGGGGGGGKGDGIMHATHFFGGVSVVASMIPKMP